MVLKRMQNSQLSERLCAIKHVFFFFFFFLGGQKNLGVPLYGYVR